MTLSGPCVEAACEKAYELIDLSHHEGVHPRLGAVDLVPLHPISEDVSLPNLGQVARGKYTDFRCLGMVCLVYVIVAIIIIIGNWKQMIVDGKSGYFICNFYRLASQTQLQEAKPGVGSRQFSAGFNNSTKMLMITQNFRL